MSAAVIRAATVDDVDIIARLLDALVDALGETGAAPSDRDALRRHGFGRQRLYHVRLAEIDAEAAGLCLYFPEFSTWRGQSGLYVQDLYVASPARGIGLGRSLLAEAARHACRDWQASYLRLAVHSANRHARCFYQHLGLYEDTDNRLMTVAGSQFDELLAR